MQTHPDARSYRTKALLNFNDLCLIYGYASADGRYSLSSHDVDIADEATRSNMGMLDFHFYINVCIELG